MPNSLSDELRTLAERLSTFAAPGKKPEYEALLSHLWETAEEVGRSWSGSNLGYHAWVHFAGLKPPPATAHWSMEWGDLRGPFSGGGSFGDWREFKPDDLLDEIYKRASRPKIGEVEDLARQAQKEFEVGRREVKSIVATASSESRDTQLDQLVEDIDSILVFTLTDALKVQLPRGGQFISHDTRAIQGGWQGAAHQQVFARINVMRSQFRACEELALLAISAATHLERRGRVGVAKPTAVTGDRVFIGHGRSLEWRALKDFLEKRLRLSTEEFNRVSAAGVATVSRLEEMLGNSAMALLVLTAEDEHGDKLAARQNVIHEAGLFQGRLGFKRAIILREETCEEFSNIHGLGQLPFPAGRISAVFEDVRQVLEREGMVAPP